MASSKKVGVFFVNLGTPDAPEPRAVGRYLREFLMDPLVVDIPWALRWFLVNVIIAPRRSHTSAEAYEKVWTGRGSPLAFHLEDLTRECARQLGDDFLAVAGMRYGNPSIRSGLEKFRAAGVEDIIVVPLFPQYSLAAYESAKQKVEAEAASVFPTKASLRFLPPFYDHPEFIQSFTAVGKEHLPASGYDHVLFSFHGVPERHVKKTDPSGSHCLTAPDCCERAAQQGVDLCYRAHSYRTAQLLAQQLGIPREKYSVAFQSRLGRTPWIRPYTDEVYVELAQQGIKRLVIFSPSFVADCLETLEEIGLRAKAEFQGNGGETLTLIPSLNATPRWVEGLTNAVRSLATSG